MQSSDALSTRQEDASPVTTKSNRKINDERILRFVGLCRAGSCSYLRCNRSVDENFLPGVRGALGAAAAVPAAALVVADAIALRRAEAAVADESSFVSSVSLVAKAVGDDDSDVFRFADRMESSSADSDAGGGSNPVGDGCDATAATAAARIGLPPLLRGENTRAAAAAIRASLDWRSWIAISWGTMALPSPSPLSGVRAGGGESFILVPLLHRLSFSRIVFWYDGHGNIMTREFGAGTSQRPATRLSSVCPPSVLLKNCSSKHIPWWSGHDDVLESTKKTTTDRDAIARRGRPRSREAEKREWRYRYSNLCGAVAQQIPAKRLVDDRLRSLQWCCADSLRQ